MILGQILEHGVVQYVILFFFLLSSFSPLAPYVQHDTFVGAYVSEPTHPFAGHPYIPYVPPAFA
jgi:hypothetical protein